jgi:hypothetical protein
MEEAGSRAFHPPRTSGPALQSPRIVRLRTERMNSPQQPHEVRLRGLSVTDECHAGTDRSTAQGLGEVQAWASGEAVLGARRREGFVSAAAVLDGE